MKVNYSKKLPKDFDLHVMYVSLFQSFQQTSDRPIIACLAGQTILFIIEFGYQNYIVVSKI